jgi:CHAT domain-containing protein
VGADVNGQGEIAQAWVQSPGRNSGSHDSEYSLICTCQSFFFSSVQAHTTISITPPAREVFRFCALRLLGGGHELRLLSLRQRAVAASLLGSALVLWLATQAWRRDPQRKLSPSRAQLIATIGSVRVTVGRLHGFPYVPLGSDRKPNASVVASFVKDHRRDWSPESIANAALLNLMSSGQIDRAVSKLERARRKAPGDATIASDLSVAYLERARKEGFAHDYMLALDAAEAASELDGALPEAWFNMALADEGLSLTAAARTSWARYLALDGGSAWADEARSRQHKLPREDPWAEWTRAQANLDAAVSSGDRAIVDRIVQQFRGASRVYGEVELLGRWAAHEIRGDHAAAERFLAGARALGVSLAALGGDLMLQDEVAAIDCATGRPSTRSALASGHQLFFQAWHLYTSYRSPEAAVMFTHSARLLAQGGSPFRHWARFFAAACAYQESDYNRALAGLDAMETGALPDRYPVLVAWEGWCRGLIHYIRAQPAAAVKCYLGALASFQRAGELENESAVEALLAETYSLLGDDDASWAHLKRSLALANQVRDLRRRQQVFQTAAEAAMNADTVRAALHFDEEALRAAQAAGYPVPMILVLRELAGICHRLGREREASEHLTAAWAIAHKVGDEALKAEILLAQAKIGGPESREKSIADLSAALPILKRTEYRRQLATLYLSRGELQAAAGRLELAKTDYETGIRQLVSTSGSLDPIARATFLDHSSALFEQMVQVDSRIEGAPRAGAFHDQERARGQALSAWRMSGGARAPAADILEVSRSLPTAVTLVEYAVLPDRILVWVVGRNSIRSSVLPVSQAAIGKLVTTLRVEIARSGAAGTAGEAVYSAILAPLDLPPVGSTLLFVPDKALYQVPYGCLRNPKTGHYLVEDYGIELSLSASAYLLGAARAGPSGFPVSILAVGDPAFDRALAPSRERLPGAAVEAKAVASLYSSAELLIGPAATKDRFLSALANHSIVHLAAHAETDEHQPLFSRFLLAPSGGDPGVLFAHELFGRRLNKTSLVILSGCNTASGKISMTEGVASLAEPFLADGVQAVIASLWEVDDSAGGRFALVLHGLLRFEKHFSCALRNAQLQMLRSGIPEFCSPKAWAGFQLYQVGVSSDSHNGKEVEDGSRGIRNSHLPLGTRGLDS